MKRKRPPCPRCGSTRVRPIVYGLPGPEQREAGRRGRTVLGGCIVGFAEWHCKACQHAWPQAPVPIQSAQEIEARRQAREVQERQANELAYRAVIERWWQQRTGKFTFLVRFADALVRVDRFQFFPPHGKFYCKVFTDQMEAPPSDLHHSAAIVAVQRYCEREDFVHVELSQQKQ